MLKGDECLMTIRGKPNSKFNAITDVDDCGVGVSINAQPKDGEANEELLGYLRQVFGIKKHEIYLDKGGTSKNKILVVNLKSSGMSVAEIYQILKTEMGNG